MFATKLIRQRRARRDVEEQHARMAERIEKIKDIFKGKEGIGGVSCLHWDLLQVLRRTNTAEQFSKLSSPQTLGQLDLAVTGSRRDLVKKMLTTRFRDRLKDEESDILKKRKRDSSNNLMASDVDKLMEEDSKSSAGLSKVGSTNSIELDKTR